MANLKNTKGAKTKPEEATENTKVEAPEVQPETVDEVVTEDVPEITVDVTETVANPTEDNKDKVVAETPEVKPLPDKKVKVRLSQNHKCHIGGESYYFVAGKVYTVPKNVKDILSRAGLLTAI